MESTFFASFQVQEDFDEVTATEESEREFKQDLRGGLADNLCDEDGANQSSLQGEGEECVESIQVCYVVATTMLKNLLNTAGRGMS